MLGELIRKARGSTNDRAAAGVKGRDERVKERIRRSPLPSVVGPAIVISQVDTETGGAQGGEKPRVTRKQEMKWVEKKGGRAYKREEEMKTTLQARVSTRRLEGVQRWVGRQRQLGAGGTLILGKADDPCMDPRKE